VPTFLAELYCPKRGASAFEAVARRARIAVDELRRQGLAVRYAGSLVVPEDETCFLLFEASSPEDVVQIGSRIGLSFERIVEALERLPSITFHEGGQS